MPVVNQRFNFVYQDFCNYLQQGDQAEGFVRHSPQYPPTSRRLTTM
jgi:hypothetical protein